MPFQPKRKTKEHALVILMLDSYSKAKWMKLIDATRYELDKIIEKPKAHLNMQQIEVIAQALHMPLYSIVALLQGFTLDEI